jgi:hypothetical protein
MLAFWFEQCKLEFDFNARTNGHDAIVTELEQDIQYASINTPTK